MLVLTTSCRRQVAAEALQVDANTLATSLNAETLPTSNKSAEAVCKWQRKRADPSSLASALCSDVRLSWRRSGGRAGGQRRAGVKKPLRTPF